MLFALLIAEVLVLVFFPVERADDDAAVRLLDQHLHPQQIAVADGVGLAFPDARVVGVDADHVAVLQPWFHAGTGDANDACGVDRHPILCR